MYFAGEETDGDLPATSKPILTRKRPHDETDFPRDGWNEASRKSLDPDFTQYAQHSLPVPKRPRTETPNSSHFERPPSRELQLSTYGLNPARRKSPSLLGPSLKTDPTSLNDWSYLAPVRRPYSQPIHYPDLNSPPAWLLNKGDLDKLLSGTQTSIPTSTPDLTGTSLIWLNPLLADDRHTLPGEFPYEVPTTSESVIPMSIPGMISGPSAEPNDVSNPFPPPPWEVAIYRLRPGVCHLFEPKPYRPGDSVGSIHSNGHLTRRANPTLESWGDRRSPSPLNLSNRLETPPPDGYTYFADFSLDNDLRNTSFRPSF
ncbi:hypothetical protein TREMEDRAFT_63661 [Tremella mesenterica DSM 1558]|uniref:uncharacterized protein n=1 Tax=Tremella mesenterica (strain ATCC 24925 / CBS 8224 / DSM 1558 / NBRC 9311 / NRRL Y-6157 / RJB 2259-6 / UBC 559-6) TaxID=578456 RepID=UPI0003F494EA|nr:uncharacterized protein TREMEDRAFT_63661 [Tremella mesenterica DSM 1558]EIW68488.1 hypothetical protein TREMEDRAFT_63661 [Tremella mesenterica DSM 1558]